MITTIVRNSVVNNPGQDNRNRSRSPRRLTSTMEVQVTYSSSIDEMTPWPIRTTSSDNGMATITDITYMEDQQPARFYEVTATCLFQHRHWYKCEPADRQGPAMWWAKWWQPVATTNSATYSTTTSPKYDWMTWTDYFGNVDHSIVGGCWVQRRWWTCCVSHDTFPTTTWWTKFWLRDQTYVWSPASEWPQYITDQLTGA